MAANTQTNNLLVSNDGLTEKVNADSTVSINAMALTAASGNGLAVTADISVGGDAAVTGDVNVTDALTVGGASSLNTLATSGAATLNSLSVTTTAAVGQTLAVTGATTLSNTLAVTGASTFSNDVTLSGATSDLSVGGTASVTGTATIGGNLTAQSQLAVTGTTSLADKLTVSSNGADITGNVAITGNETVSGTLGVTGNTNLTTLSTSGAATLNSAAVTANATVGGTLSVTGNSSLSGTLAVTGTSTFNDDVTIVNGKDLSIGSDLSVGGTAAVTGALSTNSTFSANSTGSFGGALTVSSGGASITGNSTVTGTLSATSDLSAGGTLSVTGAATLSDNLTVAGDIDVGNGDFQVTASSGAVTMNGPGALTVTGPANLDGGITVDSTNFTVSGTTGAVHTAGDFDVATNKFTVAAASGNTAVAGTLAVTDAITGSSSISGNSGAFTTTLSAADADIAATLNVGTGNAFQVANNGAVSTSSTLSVSDATTLSSTLAVTGAATLSSSLGVTGNVNVNNNFTVDAATGNVSTDGTLSVALTSTLTGDVAMGEDLTVAGTSTFSNAVTALSTLGVTGLITGSAGAAFTGDVDITGDLTVEGDIVAKNKVNITVDDYFIDLGVGNTTTNAQSGGLTVEMNRNVDFTNVWSNLTFVAGITATSAPTITAGTAGSALANGDIIVVVFADENSGYYIVNSVAGSVITLKGVGGAPVSQSVPFAQNQVQAGAFSAAQLFKADIAVMAVANGSANFKNPTGGSWPKGTFITAMAINATEVYFGGNNAWTSVGQVDLQEAYDTGNSIALTAGRNLIVSKGAGVASIQYQAAGSSFYQVAADSGQSLNVGVVPAAGGATQAQLQFDDVRSAGNYDAMLVAEGQVTVQADGGAFLAQAKTGSATVKAVDAGNALKSQVVANIDGSLQVQATSGVMQVTAKGGFSTVDMTGNIELWNPVNRKNSLANGQYAADMTNLPFTDAIADGVLVAVSSTGFVAADPTNAPNIIGATLSASAGSGAGAFVANTFGNLVSIAKTGNVSLGQVVYLAANGQISATAPSTAGQTIMRVGYVVARAAQANPLVYFAPQFIAKVL